jgi:hypothetical protein
MRDRVVFGSEIWATEAEILAVSSVFDCNIKVLIENKSDINNWQIFRPKNYSIKNTNYEISVQYGPSGLFLNL